jgi:hypothetical protein
VLTRMVWEAPWAPLEIVFLLHRLIEDSHTRTSCRVDHARGARPEMNESLLHLACRTSIQDLASWRGLYCQDSLDLVSLFRDVDRSHYHGSCGHGEDSQLADLSCGLGIALAGVHPGMVFPVHGPFCLQRVERHLLGDLEAFPATHFARRDVASRG